MNPAVSVITPVYNAAGFIERAVKSVLVQAFTDLELIVVDDGSTDETADIVRSCIDPRVVYLHQPNAGQGAARNVGVRQSRGDLITFLDADDYYLADKIQHQAKFLQTHPGFRVVYCNALHYLEDRPGTLYRSRIRGQSGRLLPELLRTSYMNLNTVMMAKEVLNQIGPFNETRYYPEEWEMWLKITLAGYQFGYIDEDLVVVEVRENSNTLMEIQPVLKANAVRMFITVLPPVVEIDGTRFPTAPAIRALKWKQVVAHLVVGQRLAAARLAAEVVRPAVLGYVLGAVLALLPPRFVRWIWRRRQTWRWEVVKGVRVDDARGQLLVDHK